MYHHKSGIQLRKLERRDLVELLDLKQESWWGTHGTPILNMEDQVQWFNELSPNTICMIAMIPSPHCTDRWLEMGVAVYEIDHANRCLRLSGSVFKQHRNEEKVKKAFEAGLDFAFEMINVDRVEAEVLEYHLPAQHLEIDHLGFTVEGRRREAVYKCGRYYDSIMLGMLRREWLANTRVMALGSTCNKNFDHDTMNKMIERANRDTTPV
jgi:RimJ/RimL family protein N-acetyltransferase